MTSGTSLAATSDVFVRIQIDVTIDILETQNIIAETTTGPSTIERRRGREGGRE
jgi:hypothetical protein